MNAEDKFCLKWNDFQENIKTSFSELRGDKDFADVTLACEDGELEGHKVILSSCSPFFNRLLKKTSKHQHPLLYMRGLKASQLRTVVDFIYYGEVNILQEELEGFLLLAEELELKGLTGGAEDTGMGKQQSQQESNSEFVQSKCEERLKTENYITSNHEFEITNKKGTQNEDSYKQTWVSTRSTEVMPNLSKPKVNIGNDILQMRETLFEKLDGLWTCKVCNFSSRASTHLREHVEKHIEGVEYPCNQCGKIMRSSKSLRCHYNGSRCPFTKTKID